MMPVYKCMDSQPCQINQVPFPHYYFPGFLNNPPYPSRCPDLHGYPIPCHGYYSHCNYGDFNAFRPPCSYMVPSFHCCGNYLAFPPVHHVPYYFIPPQCSDDQLRYENYKDVPEKHHCCECPNHRFNQKNDRSVKIEEQEPEVDMKMSDSAVPVQSKNHRYPIVWIGPEYMKNKMQVEPAESEEADWKGSQSNTKVPENANPSETEPRVWNGWFPLDMSNLKSLIQGQEEGRTMCGKNEDKTKEFPFPIAWMPSCGKGNEIEKQDNRKSNATSTSTEGKPSNLKVHPVKLSAGDDGISMPRACQENSDCGKVSTETKEKSTSWKDIPVKKIEECRNVGDTEKTTEDADHTEDIRAKDKHSGGTMRRQSSSPPKTSKLSPVCLRVDPLPRKKNGSSRSPSPSKKGQMLETPERSKDRLEAPVSPSSKGEAVQTTQTESSALERSKDVEPNKKESENALVRDKMAGESKGGEHWTGCGTHIPIKFHKEVVTDPAIGRIGKDRAEHETEVDGGVSHMGGSIAQVTDEAKEGTKSADGADGECSVAKRSNLSDVQAAEVIQSAYRGYEVRKWEPLKKLKHITKVREQVGEVKDRIQALMFSSDIQKADRERAVIGEMIMTLLLKLDSIQGLHPNLRDIRKSLVRELVNLQEKLDSLKKPEEVTGLSTMKPADHLGADTCGLQGMENKEDGAGESSSEKKCYDDMKLANRDQAQFLHIMDWTSDSQSKEVSDALPALEDIPGDGTNRPFMPSGEECQVAEPIVPSVECHVGESVLMTEPGDEAPNAEPDDAQVRTPEAHKKVEVPSRLEQLVQSLSAAEEPGDEAANAEPGDAQAVTTDTHKKVETASELDQFVQFPSAAEEFPKMSLEDLYQGPEEGGEPKLVKTDDDDILELNESRELLEDMIIKGQAASGLVKNEKIGDERDEIEQGREETNVTTSPVLLTEVDYSMPLEKDPEFSEPPVGVLADDLVEKHAALESDGEVRLEKEKKGPLIDEAPSQVQLYEQVQEVESDDWFKVEFQMGEECLGDAAYGEAEKQLTKDCYNTKPLVVSYRGERTAEEGVAHKEERGEGVDGRMDSDRFASESAVRCATSDEKEASCVQKEGEIGQPESIIKKEQECVLETAAEEIPVSCEERDADKKEMPQSFRENSVNEHEELTERDRKLIEENQKLREMMGKLMEAGKEQLDVISSLTGKVKNLEKKLVKKKLRMARPRKATSVLSCAKPINKLPKQRAAGVAM